ncbi:MAG: oligopeptidase A, partial [Gammaproteobacteria bacterium]
GKQKEQYRDISRQLAELASRFEETVLDATQAWKKHVLDETALVGLPDSALALARQTAERQGLEGYLLTLEIPSYQPVVTYAEDATLRAEAYQAYVTRASDQGPDAGRWNNAEVMEKLLALRHQMAGLLGYPNYAALALEKRMARSTDEVMSFLTDLATRSRAVAERELEELQAFARTEFDVDKLEAWDIAFYSERLRLHKHAISQEELRPYFPLPRVLEGMFAVAERLFGVRIKATDGADTWHPDVGFFNICDASGKPCGQFFLDPFARPHKRGGAWMDECVVRRRTADGIQRPVAFLTCNFSPPVGEQPSLLTHDEATTLFHEFGHGLHHLLTRVEWRSVSGINGVPWDAVELPSQLLENWCWERQALDLISGHWETGETLPEDMFRKLRSAKNFQSGIQMVRQLEFALFDFRLHLDYDPAKGAHIQEILNDVRRQVAVLTPPAFNRFQHSFSHIFAGGYAAGYYSYKWAEVLSSDVYSAFEERGVFDRDTGRRFLDTILQQGGSRDAMALFLDFRGREPEIDALLRHNGINGDNATPGGNLA